MGLMVKGHRILIKPDRVKDQRKVDIGGKLKELNFEIAVPDEKREEAATQIGTVIQIGKMAFRAFDGKERDWEPWCKVGDRVIFARYSGKFVEDPTTREKFMVLNDEDVQVVVTGEANPFGE